MGSIGWGGVWSVTHAQRVRGRDNTQVGGRTEERPESQEDLYGEEKKRDIFIWKVARD